MKLYRADLPKVKKFIIYGFVYGYSDDAILELLMRTFIQPELQFSLIEHPMGKYFFETGFIPSQDELNRNPIKVISEVQSRRLIPGNFPDDGDLDTFLINGHVEVDAPTLRRWNTLLGKLRESDFSEVCKDYFFTVTFHDMGVWF